MRSTCIAPEYAAPRPIKNAIRLKKINPKMNVYVLYRDIRTYGFYEEYYQQARALGVVFIRYDEDRKPVIERGEDDSRQITVRVRDHVLGTDLEIKAAKVILAPAMVPQEDASVLSQMLKIPLNEDNFFMEAHVKLRPVDFSAEGIFLAGLAHSPKMVDETISQAKAAAERACTIISSDEYLSVANVASVDADICAGCGMCVAACPYGAPGLVWRGGRQISVINTALCKGCGSCSAVCPSGASQQSVSKTSRRSRCWARRSACFSSRHHGFAGCLQEPALLGFVEHVDKRPHPHESRPG